MRAWLTPPCERAGQGGVPAGALRRGGGRAAGGAVAAAQQCRPARSAARRAPGARRQREARRGGRACPRVRRVGCASERASFQCSSTVPVQLALGDVSIAGCCRAMGAAQWGREFVPVLARGGCAVSLGFCLLLLWLMPVASFLWQRRRAAAGARGRRGVHPVHEAAVRAGDDALRPHLLPRLLRALRRPLQQVPHVPHGARPLLPVAPWSTTRSYKLPTAACLLSARMRPPLTKGSC